MIDYDSGAGRRRALLIVDSPGARARAEAVAHDAALAVRDVLDVADAAVGQDAGPGADLIWIEVDHDGGDAYDRLLRRVAGLARGGYPVAIAIRPELIDVTDAALDGAPVTLLCGGGRAERAAAVETLLAGGRGVLREEGGDRETRLRAISADLTRIAERLVAVTDPGTPPTDGVVPNAVASADDDDVVVEADDFRRILRRRRMRDLFLGNALFADPAWDMLLDLAAARLEDKAVAVSSLCIAAAVPATTALRWIQTLTERGLLVRTPDGQDGRRVIITLAPAAAQAMDAYVRHAYLRDGRVPIG